MFPAGEAKLASFITELDLPHGESFIVVVNNSQLPFDGANPLGVLHKAVIESPDPNGRASSIRLGSPRAQLRRAAAGRTGALWGATIWTSFS